MVHVWDISILKLNCEDKMLVKPYSASFLVSEKCNLNCSCCFEKNKNSDFMSPEIAIKSVNFLFNNFAENLSNKFLTIDDRIDITLFGGEPLLNFDTIKVILKESDKLKEETGFKFGINIITNGTIMSDEIVKTLKFYNQKNDNIFIQLSIDGLKESHDYYRKYYDGKGSFDVIMRNLPKFKEIFGGEDFYKDEITRSRLHIHGSLNKKTIKTMYESWKYFTDEINIPYVWFMPIHDENWNDEDVVIYDEQLTKIANDILIKSIEEKSLIYIKDFSPLNKCLSTCKTGFDKPCGAGHSYCSITASGDVYPCHQFYYIDKHHFKIGSIDSIDETKRSLYVRYDEADMNCSKRKCKNYNCYRCIAENYSKNGTILNCEISKRCEMSTIEERIRNRMKDILENYKGEDK